MTASTHSFVFFVGLFIALSIAPSNSSKASSTGMSTSLSESDDDSTIALFLGLTGVFKTSESNGSLMPEDVEAEVDGVTDIVASNC